MIDLYGIVSIPFLKKSAFTGSFRKMRYRLEKVVVEGEERLKATFWWRDVCWEKGFGTTRNILLIFLLIRKDWKKRLTG